MKYLRKLIASLREQAMERIGTQAISEISWELNDTRLAMRKLLVAQGSESQERESNWHSLGQGTSTARVNNIYHSSLEIQRRGMEDTVVWQGLREEDRFNIMHKA